MIRTFYNILCPGLMVMFFFLFGLRVEAQSLSYERFTHFSVELGLRNNFVSGIIQDANNFIWIATKDGINKFDGVNFQNYTLPGKSGISASDNIVTAISKLDESPVYCGTTSGNIYYYDRRKDQFILVKIPSKKSAGYQVNSIVPIDENRILAAIGETLYAIDLHQVERTWAINIGSNINDLELDDNTLWIGCSDGLHKMKKSSVLTSHQSKGTQINKVLDNIFVIEICKVGVNRLWLGSRKQGVAIFNTDEGKKIQIDNSISKQLGKQIPIRHIQQLPNGNMVVGTDGEGIIFVDAELKFLKRLRLEKNNAYSLSNNSVYDILFDSDDNMWVATHGGGLNYSSESGNGFQRIQQQIDNPNSLRDNVGRSFLQTPDGNFWFGMNHGVIVWNPKTGESKRLTSIPDQPVLSMDYSEEGYVWIGMYRKGLLRINANDTDKVTQISLPNSATRSIFKVLVDSQNRIWCGGIFKSSFVYDNNTEKVEVIGLPNTMTMHQHGDEYMYFGTVYGLWRVDTRNLRHKRVLFDSNNFNRNRIYSITADHEFPEEKLWLGTEGGGLISWDIVTNETTSTTQSQGISSNIIYGIVNDRKGNLWMGTSNGLTRLNKKDNSYTVYNYADGLTDQGFIQGAYGKTSSGELVFGGLNGFTLINPDSLTKSTKIPKLNFTEFRLFGKKLEIQAADSILDTHIDLVEKITLSHNQNSISFQFVAVQFTNPEKIQYQWRLDGFDENWSVPSNKHEAIYTNIPPGNYQFIVKASNTDGFWGNNERKIQVTIKPPLWRTPWAYLLYLVVALVLINFVMQFSRIRIRAKNAREKTSFFANIAHEIKTPLALIKAPIEAIIKEDRIHEEDAKWLELATKNTERLNRLITQLLDFQEADQYKMKLHLKEVELKGMIQSLIESFEPVLKEKRIDCNLVAQDDQILVALDFDKIEKVFVNLISNAIKYSNSDSKIQISITRDKNTVVFAIRDTGIGIPKKYQSEIFKQFYRADNAKNHRESGSGVGLMLTKKIIDLHGGKISFVSAENAGSTFSVELPIREYSDIEVANQELNNATYKSTKKTLKVNVNSETIDNQDYQILIIEDNHDMLTFIGNTLKAHYNVLLAENGKVGLEVAKEHLPDLIISDIMMPEMNGKQVCEILKSELNTSHIPIILLTALSSSKNKIEGLNIGADAYLEKPFNMDELLAQISNLIASRNNLREKWKQDEFVPKDQFTNLDQEFIEQVKAFVVSNMNDNDIKIEQLATEMCMSRSVLFRKIKALTGESPQSFVRLVKLQKAKKLFEEGHFNVSTVAYDAGFSNPKSFSTNFKKQFGISPSEYIKELKNPTEV